MREIKFRAWCDVCQKMILNPYAFRQHNDGLFYQCPNHEVHTQTAIMQYTGLKDKNGKEIYEGDIVHFGYGIPPVAVNAPIEYKNCAFYAITSGHKPSKCLVSELVEYVGEFEVIGNTHENPELLNAA